MTADAAEAAMLALAQRAPDGVLRLGSLVTAGAEKLVVLGLDPLGAGRIAPETEVRLEVGAAPAAGTRDAYDAAIVVDHGARMRSSLPQARAGVERFLANAADVAPRVSLLGYAREPFRLVPLKPTAQVRATQFDGLIAKGPSAPVEGLDLALAEVLRGEPGDRRAVVLVTNGGAAKAEDASRLVDVGLRAKRLGVEVHAWDLGATTTPGLAEAAKATGGTLARGADGLRIALAAMAASAGIPLEWREAPAAGADVEFEVVVRAIPPDPPDFPKIPRRRGKGRG